ncbi:MAG: hypothetical protein HC828_09370 [Blastochloris sp.]|nr:hypothetical protein [Blastochloris sp.]
MIRNFSQKILATVGVLLVVALLVVLIIGLLYISPSNLRLISSIGGLILGVAISISIRGMITNHWQAGEANGEAIINGRSLAVVCVGGVLGNFLLLRFFSTDVVNSLIAAFLIAITTVLFFVIFRSWS